MNRLYVFVCRKSSSVPRVCGDVAWLTVAYRCLSVVEGNPKRGIFIDAAEAGFDYAQPSISS